MLLEIAMGDAYGVGFEFVRPIIIEREHDFSCYRDSKIDEIKAGQYSDDTQMSLAIAELMHEGGEWTVERVADAFLSAFKRDKRPAYQKAFYDLLDKAQSGQDLLSLLQRDSTRNGSAMRAVPIGLYRDKTEVLEKAKLQATVTHFSWQGILAAQAVALSAHYFMHIKGTRDGLVDYLDEELGYRFAADKETRCQCEAIDTVEAVLTALTREDSLLGIIDYAVTIGGDTDSVAAIACGIASCSPEYARDLPDFFEDDLENGAYGREYLKDLDGRLWCRLNGW